MSGSADKSISAELDNADVSQTLINYSDSTAWQTQLPVEIWATSNTIMSKMFWCPLWSEVF